MPRKLICGAAALALLAAAPNRARAHFAGAVPSGSAVRIAVTTITGDVTAVTITELGHDKVRDVISLSPASGQTEAAELTPSRNTRRLIIEVDHPSAGSARIEVTAEGAPVFPIEVINTDKRYALDVQQ
jgi:hypothetical protein